MKINSVKILSILMVFSTFLLYSANAAPINSTLPQIAGTNQVESTLRANRGDWLGTIENYIYQWRRCTEPVNAATCIAISGQTSLTYKIVFADSGKYIRFNVIAIDKSGATTSVLSAATPQIIAPPTSISKPSISGNVSLGGTLSTTNGVWSQPNQGVYRYKWFRCSSTQESSCKAISGAITNTYVVNDNDIGKNLRSEVNVFESTGKVSISVKSNSTGFVSSIPKNLSIPVITGSATSNEKILLNIGNWVAYPEASYSQKWQRCSSINIETCQDIPNQTSLEYITTSTDLNSYLRVSVTGLNNLGGTIKFSPLFGPILPQISPVNTSSPSINGQAIEGNTLTLSNGTWSGLPTPTLTYKWFRCENVKTCIEIVGANQNTYLLTMADGNNSIKASVIASNSLGSAVASTSLIPIQGAFQILVYPKIEGPISVGKTIKVDKGTWFPTPDVDYSYIWQTCSSQDISSCLNSNETSNKYEVKKSDAGNYIRAGVALIGKSAFVFTKLSKEIPGGKISPRKGLTCSKAKAKAYGPKGNILICKKLAGKLVWT